ncbi:MAG: T9SS type A sorting domain-containing protein [Bacteroidota bacterium]
MRIISIFGLLTIFVFHSLEASVKKVPQDYAKIQLAINAAVNGDTVLVSDGTYKENLVLTKKITVASLYFQDKNTSHISNTILDGSSPTNPDSASVITIDGATDTTTMIVGFTIKGGKGNVYNTYRMGFAFDVEGGGATIRKNIITANNVTTTQNAGGVINIWDMTETNKLTFVIVEDNTIADNVVQAASAEGGAFGIGGNCRIVRNRILRNTAFGTGSGYGGAAQIWNGIITFDGNLIADNYASHWGGAIQANQFNAYVPIITFVNNIFANNSAGTQGGALWVSGSLSKMTSINNTFVGNTSPNGASLYMQSGSFKALNTILWNSGVSEIVRISGSIAVAYSNIRGGFTGVGNIDTNPLFKSTNIDSLGILQDTSRCIGTGISSASVGGVTLNAPFVDYYSTTRPRGAGTNPDMGAVENDLPTAVEVVNNLTELPISFELSQNYPNPFNPTTKIRYALPSSAQVKLVIYDIMGREIETLVNEEQFAGWKEMEWNAHNVSSGIYFYKLTTRHASAGSGQVFVEVKKMLLVR